MNTTFPTGETQCHKDAPSLQTVSALPIRTSADRYFSGIFYINCKMKLATENLGQSTNGGGIGSYPIRYFEVPQN